MKRKIRKYRGGGMDASKPDFGAKSTTKSPFSAGNQGATKFTKSVTTTNKNTGNKNVNVNNRGSNQNSFTSNFGLPNFSFPTTTGIAVKSLTAVENARRKKRAKGEFFLSRKKEMPITRDFYRSFGRPLDTKIGSIDEPYMKEAGIIGFKKPIREDKRSPIKRCPDGTRPPCKKINNTNINQQVKPQQNFFNLELNKGGGVPYGPPPKSGPNSQVPPVKLSRGGGAAIKGIKFKGVF